VGFRRLTYRLTFDGVYEGLEVHCDGASLGEIVDVQSALSLGRDLISNDPVFAEQRERMVEIIGAKLLSWNLEDDKGNPVECNAKQFAEEDWSLVIAIARGWLYAGVGIPAPLSQASSDGVPSGVASTPMEILSESQPN
jgi:hypothetical protein